MTTIPTKKRGRPTQKPPIEMLATLYEHMTAKEIADKYDVKESTVRTWLWSYRKAGE